MTLFDLLGPDPTLPHWLYIGFGRSLTYVICGVKGTPNWHIVKVCVSKQEAVAYIDQQGGISCPGT